MNSNGHANAPRKTGAEIAMGNTHMNGDQHPALYSRTSVFIARDGDISPLSVSENYSTRIDDGEQTAPHTHKLKPADDRWTALRIINETQTAAVTRNMYSIQVK